MIPKNEPTMMNGKSMEKASRIASRYLLLEIFPAIGIMMRSKLSIKEFIM